MVGNVDNKLRLSVIIPAYNRGKQFHQTLRHLAEQDLDPAAYEVVIIDDGSTDDTRAVVEEWMSRAPFRLRYTYQSNHGPGHAYNRALEAAEAPIVLYSADDMLLPPQSLKAHLATHEANPQQEIAVLGPVARSPMLDQSVFLRKWDRMRPSRFAGVKEVPYYRFWTCNVSAKREFVLRHGRMQEPIGSAGPIAHQDPELGYQLSHHGLRILYCPEAVSYSHEIMTLDEACRKSYNRGWGFGEFRNRVGQPEIAVAYHIWDISTVRDHLRIWFGPRRCLVAASDRNPVLLLGWYFLRGLAFNAVTLRFLWLPLVKRAERDPKIAKLMPPQVYSGVIAYYLVRGYRESRVWTSASAPQPKQA